MMRVESGPEQVGWYGDRRPKGNTSDTLTRESEAEPQAEKVVTSPDREAPVASALLVDGSCVIRVRRNDYERLRRDGERENWA